MKHSRTLVQEQLAAQPTSLETQFANLWASLGGPELKREYQFDLTRRWRFDYVLADLSRKIAIECEGGTFTHGRHTRGTGYSNDAIKYNHAAARGWTVFRLTSDMLTNDPVGHLGLILGFVGRRSDVAE